MALAGKKRLREEPDEGRVTPPVQPQQKRYRPDEDEAGPAPPDHAPPATAQSRPPQAQTRAEEDQNSAHTAAEAVDVAVREASPLQDLQPCEVYEEAQRVLEGKGELVGRTTERSRIETFWEEAVGGRRAASIYISGAPGCGKTASVMALKRLQHKKYRALPRNQRPRVVYINCMKLVNPQKAIFHAIAAKLDIEVAVTAAEAALRSHFTAEAETVKAMTVLICDEIDALESSEVLYSLFAMPALRGSSLVLIGIANALVLTEEVLPRLKHSNCKPETLFFAPYKSSQLMEIVLERLAGSRLGSLVGLFERDALLFCAGKVSSQTSDVRTALQMMSQAVAVAQEQYEKECDDGGGASTILLVSVMHVSLASRAKSPVVRVIKQLPVQQNIAKLALQSDGSKIVGGMDAILRVFKGLPMARPLRPAEASALVDLLREQSLVTKKGLNLDVHVEDVAMALALEPFLPETLQELLTR